MSLLYLCALSLLHAALYVACIYAAVAMGPPVDASSRDHPLVIGRRIRGAVLATLLSLAVTALILRHASSGSGWLQPMGLDPRTFLASSGVSLLLTAALYLGPLTMDHLDGAFGWHRLRISLGQSLRDPVCWRNYFVGPITEELVFRSAVVPLWITMAAVDPLVCVLVSPLAFAVAHIHHAVASLWGGEEMRRVLVRMALQLAYTTVFGCYAVGLFLRTRSVAGPIVAHAFCNIQGLPSLGRIGDYPRYKYLLWLVHVVGLLAMVLLFEPMTRPGVFISNDNK
ncbi:CAAX prenyl protease [Coemansia sp. RSA 2050]|nr:CAAX prenyl protease [Coemansia sp. RSA 2050]KAJ2733133.1 CAAX prenyl protease [Coemansia sp. BCRC 34962]